MSGPGKCPTAWSRRVESASASFQERVKKAKGTARKTRTISRSKTIHKLWRKGKSKIEWQPNERKQEKERNGGGGKGEDGNRHQNQAFQPPTIAKKEKECQAM
jgi:hypothetical protein